MEIIKFALIGILCAVLVVVVRQQRPELAIIVQLAVLQDGTGVSPGHDHGGSRPGGLLHPLDQAVDHAGVAVHHPGPHGVDGTGVDFKGILHNGHNGRHGGKGQHNAQQQQYHIVGLREKGLYLVPENGSLA